jgi:C4-dicarboxylate-specific signal transduction histidine kinase
MLQRIVFNLVANAMDALSELKPLRPGIAIELQQQAKDGKNWVVLQIQDNGPGLPDELLQQLTGPVASSKAQGSGLGLLLTQSMIRLWGGHTTMQNLSPPTGTGAWIELWLRPSEPVA